MSRKSKHELTKRKPRNPDRRVVETRNRLGDALIALIQAEPFDSITVQQVLDRADVSRSTFYTHYKDKNDLLLGDTEDFFEHISTALTRTKEKSERVMPVREFFAHVHEAGNVIRALRDTGRYHDLMELAQESFARGIERRMADSTRGQRIPESQRAALAHAHAGALLALMTWWIRRGMPATPAQMDDLFHSMVWPGVHVPSPSPGKTTNRSSK